MHHKGLFRTAGLIKIFPGVRQMRSLSNCASDLSALMLRQLKYMAMVKLAEQFAAY